MELADIQASHLLLVSRATVDRSVRLVSPVTRPLQATRAILDLSVRLVSPVTARHQVTLAILVPLARADSLDTVLLLATVVTADQ